MRRAFSIADQQRFAELSGDANPMHVDPLAARRLLFGRPVVHGIHLVLWALDGAGLPGVARLKAEFMRPVPIDTVVECRIAPTRIELYVGNLLCVAITVEAAAAAARRESPPAPPSHECRVHAWAELVKASGELPLGLDETAGRELFPRALETLSPLGVAELLATTRLVGMECPGLHSLYSSFELVRRERPIDAPLLRWQVAQADPRFRLLRMRVEAPLSTGTVDALLRPPPSAQLTIEEAKRLVQPNEFAGQKALVLGGSRGLGEVTAKLLRAGGAEVSLSYHSGKSDAERVADEIGATSFPFDVLQPGPLPPATHLYYFATPFIFERSGRVFDPALFRRFCDYFVDGFARVVESLPGTMRILYPSTVAVDEVVPGLAEYSAAKAAGENLCRRLADRERRILCPRLPRLRTDQTATTAKVANGEPADALLPILREMAHE